MIVTLLSHYASWSETRPQTCLQLVAFVRTCMTVRDRVTHKSKTNLSQNQPHVPV